MPQEKKTGVIARILANIKGGEDKQVTDFIYKVEKQLKSEIKAAELSISKAHLDFESKESSLEDEISDLKSAVNDSLVSVDMEAIKTNSSRADYVNTYINGYERSLKRLDEKQDELLKLDSETKDKVKNLEIQIEAKEALIAKITA